jgi:hypothetical protein
LKPFPALSRWGIPEELLRTGDTGPGGRDTDSGLGMTKMKTHILAEECSIYLLKFIDSIYGFKRTATFE